MLLVQDGDIRGLRFPFVMEWEAAGTGCIRMDFAFSLCLEHSCSFGNSPGAFSFGALEWCIKAARPSPGAGQGQEEQPLSPEGGKSCSSPALGWDIPGLRLPAAHPGQHPHSPLWLPCWPRHLRVLGRLHHRAVHRFQPWCKSRGASSAQEQIAVLFMRTYAGPTYSQGFDLSLAAVRIRKSGLVQWHGSSSADGQQGKGDCQLLPLGWWFYIPSEEEKIFVEIAVLRN